MTTPVRAIYENGHLRLLDPVELEEGQQVNVNIAPVGEEGAELLSEEESAQLESLLSDYMVDGKVSLEKLKNSAKPVDIEALIEAEQKHETDS